MQLKIYSEKITEDILEDLFLFNKEDDFLLLIKSRDAYLIGI